MKGHALLGKLQIEQAFQVFEEGGWQTVPAIERINQLKDQLDAYQGEVTLPSWYKAWLLANEKKIESRPPEFIYTAMSIRASLFKILND